MVITGLIRLARPRDWIKNIFVLLPVPFALKAMGPAERQGFSLASFCLGLVGFCLVTSAVYTLNDLWDAKTDRLHPKKCRRPIASGEVSPLAAALQLAVLLVAGLGLCMASERYPSVIIVLAYVAANLAYNLGARNVALLDVFLLSSGFVIRVLLGCALVKMPPSPWLLLCTSTLALVPGIHQAAGRLERRTRLESSPQPTRLQPGVSGPGHEHLRRRGDLGVCSVLHRGQERSHALRAASWPHCPLSPMESWTTFAWSTSKASAARRSMSPIIPVACRRVPSAG